MKGIDDRSFGEVCVGDIVVLSGVRPAGRTTDARRICRPHHGILYVWSGEARFWENGRQTVTIGDGELLYIPKGHRYKMQYSRDNTTFVLVNFEMFDRDGNGLALFDKVTVLGQDDDARRIANLMTKFELSSAAQGAAAELRRKALMYRLLSMIYEENSPLFAEENGYPQIFAGVLFLKESYLENVPVTAFAKASNISVSLFRELFRKQYGMSPVQYRNRLRINRARELLEDGNYTVTEAAYAAGFENIGYFCSCYKRITGDTPSQTRQMKSGL